MKTIRFFSASLLVFSLLLCLLAVTAAPVHAAESDMDDYLAKALGISQSELSNYASNYKNSLPIEYEKNDNSCYVALGGITAVGTKVIDDYTKGYTDTIASSLGIDYENAALDGGLTTAGAVNYITKDRNASKAIPKADLITFQLDAASFIESSTQGVIDGTDIPWEKYVSDSSLLADLNNFRNEMTAEYAAEYGQKNAQSIAIVLEYMLYECVAYCHETTNVIQAIRNLNSKAVVLILGLYNPMRGLSFTANGKTISIGNMIDQMIQVCNVYLLNKTKNMAKVAFVDISAASTNAYQNVALDMSDSDALLSQLNNIKGDVNKQYANQAGHDYIRNQVLSSAKAPCKHPNTNTVNKKDPTCQAAGYTGDTVCADCGELVTKGSDISTTPHSYGAWTQSKAPTCSEAGEETRTCANCSYVEKRSVTAAGHKWNTGTVTTAPTCSKKGVKTFTCNVCKTTRTESVSTISHTWDEGKETTPPQCDAEGKMTFKCKICSATKVEAIPTIEHTWDAGTVTTAATCEAEGVKTFTCKNCSATKTEPVAVTDHTWDTGTVTTAATCKTEGVKTFTCTGCSTTKTEKISTSEHTMDEGKVTTAATCEAEGVKTFTCTGCGKTTTQPIPAIGHKFGAYTSNGDATCQKDGTKTATCEHCNAKDTVADPSTRVDHLYEDGLCTFCKAEDPSKANDTVWLIVSICAAVVAAGGGGVGIWLLKKKGTIKVFSRSE